MDHAPGPIIARVAPSIANVTEMRGLVVCVKKLHVSTTATRVPAIGVHRPSRTSIPARAPTIAGATSAACDVLAKMMTAQ